MSQLKPKVLILTSRADIGGGPKHVLDLVTSLKYYHDSDVRLFGGLPNQHYTSEIVKNLDAYAYIPPRKLSLSALIKLLQLCYKNKINVIHSHGRGASFYAFLLSFFGFKFVHTFHGIHTQKGLKGKILKALDRLILRSASKYILVSSDERTLFNEMRLDSSRTTIVPNGVSIPSVNAMTPLQEKAITLGTLTRNDPAKGNDLLVKNFITAQNELSQKIELSIAGEGFPESQAKSIHFLGPQSSKKFLGEIDVYVSNSRKEGMPLAVLEAMARGIPCLLSDVPGHQYFIENGVAIGFELDNPQAFTLSLTKTLQNRTHLGECAKKFVAQNHDVNHMANQILNIYCLMVQKN